MVKTRSQVQAERLERRSGADRSGGRTGDVSIDLGGNNDDGQQEIEGNNKGCFGANLGLPFYQQTNGEAATLSQMCSGPPCQRNVNDNTPLTGLHVIGSAAWIIVHALMTIFCCCFSCGCYILDISSCTKTGIQGCTGIVWIDKFCLVPGEHPSFLKATVKTTITLGLIFGLGTGVTILALKLDNQEITIKGILEKVGLIGGAIEIIGVGETVMVIDEQFGIQNPTSSKLKLPNDSSDSSNDISSFPSDSLTHFIPPDLPAQNTSHILDETLAASTTTPPPPIVTSTTPEVIINIETNSHLNVTTPSMKKEETPDKPIKATITTHLKRTIDTLPQSLIYIIDDISNTKYNLNKVIKNEERRDDSEKSEESISQEEIGDATNTRNYSVSTYSQNTSDYRDDREIIGAETKDNKRIGETAGETAVARDPWTFPTDRKELFKKSTETVTDYVGTVSTISTVQNRTTIERTADILTTSSFSSSTATTPTTTPVTPTTKTPTTSSRTSTTAPLYTSSIILRSSKPTEPPPGKRTPFPTPRGKIRDTTTNWLSIDSFFATGKGEKRWRRSR